MEKLPILHVSKPRIDDASFDLFSSHGISILRFIPHFLSSQNPTGGWHDFWDGLGNEIEEVIESEKEDWYENAEDIDIARQEWVTHEVVLRDDLCSAVGMVEQVLHKWIRTLPCGELIINYPAYDIEESHVSDRIFITPFTDEL